MVDISPTTLPHKHPIDKYFVVYPLCSQQTWWQAVANGIRGGGYKMQIDQSHKKSHNAPVPYPTQCPIQTEMYTFLFWMVLCMGQVHCGICTLCWMLHCGIWDRCIVGFVRLVCCKKYFPHCKIKFDTLSDSHGPLLLAWFNSNPLKFKNG